MFESLLIILLLILINALYVMAEFALVAVRPTEVHHRAESGSKLAVQLHKAVTTPERLDQYVSTCQIGITASSLLLGAYAEATMAPTISLWLSRDAGIQPLTAFSIATTAILAVLTAVQILCGELVPKSLALQFPTGSALAIILPVRFSSWLFAPLTVILNGSGTFILSLFRIERPEHHHIHSPAELEYLLAASEKEGMLKSAEHRSLKQALKLADRTVKEIMTPRKELVAVELSQSLDEILDIIHESPYTRLPVYKETEDDIVGILHVKDVLHEYAAAGEETAKVGGLKPKRSVIEHLIRPAIIVPENLHATELIHRMQDESSQLALIFDEHGGLEGLVTVDDILSQLFGEVADEFKRSAEPEELADGRIRVSATAA